MPIWVSSITAGETSQRPNRSFGSHWTLEESSVAAHYRLADVYRATKNYTKAVEHYRRVLEINPGYVWA